MHSTHKDASIDSLRRNPTDGAYHCPRCDAPFTRRSNLRRHYHIHTRNMVHKCQSCNQVFTKGDELQSHLLQCNVASSWDPSSTNQMMQAMSQYTPDIGIHHGIEFNGGLGIVGTPIHEHPPAIPDDFIHVDIFQQTESLKCHEQSTHEFQDFFSSISPALSEGPSTPSTASEITSASFPFPYIPQRSGSSSSSNGSPSLSSAVFPPSPSYLLSSEERANSIARWNKYNNTTITSTENPNLHARAVYTQKQVEDMLDTVGNCFITTIDAVLQRTRAVDLPLGQEIPELQTLNGSHGSSMSVEARKMILVETIPRLMASLQTMRDDPFERSHHTLPP